MSTASTHNDVQSTSTRTRREIARSFEGECACHEELAARLSRFYAAAGLSAIARPVAAKPSVNRLRAIDSNEADGATSIVIRGSTTPTFTVYKLDHPARVVVDVAGASLDAKVESGEDKAVWATNTWAVSQVSAHTMKQRRGDVVRVVVAWPAPAPIRCAPKATTSSCG